MAPLDASGLSAANAVFHDAYAEARNAAAREGPIFIVLGDELILRHGHRRHSSSFTAPGFHELKGGAHVLVVVLSLLSLTPGGRVDGDARTRLEVLARALDSFRKTNAGQQPGDDAACVARALEFATTVIQRALREGQIAADVLAEDSRTARPLLLELTERAAHSRLLALHARVEAALEILSPEERRNLRVVVAGDHQARARSLGVQYFTKRLPEREGGENPVIYAESVASEEQAIALVGTCRVDRTIARTLFGDPNHLQQDVLGDATKEQLDRLDLPPIGRGGK